MKSIINFAIILTIFSTGAYSNLRGEEPLKNSDDYRGFQVDYTEVMDTPKLDSLRAAIREQIDIVLVVGLPDKMRDFFKGVPIKVIHEKAANKSNPGLYIPNKKTVEITLAFQASGHKPVLLHEFLHALHHQQLDDGYKNKDVLTFFERAKAINAYPANAYMLKNDKEYFACCGTTYLFGVTAKDPFQRDKIKTAQPKFYQFLSSLFGPDAGKYQGSLKHG